MASASAVGDAKTAVWSSSMPPKAASAKPTGDSTKEEKAKSVLRSLLRLVARSFGPYEFAMICETFEVDCSDEDYSDFLKDPEPPKRRYQFIDPEDKKPDKQLIETLMRLLSQIKFHLKNKKFLIIAEVLAERFSSKSTSKPKQQKKFFELDMMLAYGKKLAEMRMASDARNKEQSDKGNLRKRRAAGAPCPTPVGDGDVSQEAQREDALDPTAQRLPIGVGENDAGLVDVPENALLQSWDEYGLMQQFGFDIAKLLSELVGVFDKDNIESDFLYRMWSIESADNFFLIVTALYVFVAFYFMYKDWGNVRQLGDNRMNTLVSLVFKLIVAFSYDESNSWWTTIPYVLAVQMMPQNLALYESESILFERRFKPICLFLYRMLQPPPTSRYFLPTDNLSIFCWAIRMTLKGSESEEAGIRLNQFFRIATFLSNVLPMQRIITTFYSESQPELKTIADEVVKNVQWYYSPFSSLSILRSLAPRQTFPGLIFSAINLCIPDANKLYHIRLKQFGLKYANLGASIFFGPDNDMGKAFQVLLSWNDFTEFIRMTLIGNAEPVIAYFEAKELQQFNTLCSLFQLIYIQSKLVKFLPESFIVKGLNVIGRKTMGKEYEQTQKIYYQVVDFYVKSYGIMDMLFQLYNGETEATVFADIMAEGMERTVILQLVAEIVSLLTGTLIKMSPAISEQLRRKKRLRNAALLLLTAYYAWNPEVPEKKISDLQTVAQNDPGNVVLNNFIDDICYGDSVCAQLTRMSERNNRTGNVTYPVTFFDFEANRTEMFTGFRNRLFLDGGIQKEIYFKDEMEYLFQTSLSGDRGYQLKFKFREKMNTQLFLRLLADPANFARLSDMTLEIGSKEKGATMSEYNQNTILQMLGASEPPSFPNQVYKEGKSLLRRFLRWSGFGGKTNIADSSETMRYEGPKPTIEYLEKQTRGFITNTTEFQRDEIKKRREESLSDNEVSARNLLFLVQFCFPLFAERLFKMPSDTKTIFVEEVVPFSHVPLLGSDKFQNFTSDAAASLCPQLLPTTPTFRTSMNERFQFLKLHTEYLLTENQLPEVEEIPRDIHPVNEGYYYGENAPTMLNVYTESQCFQLDPDNDLNILLRDINEDLQKIFKSAGTIKRATKKNKTKSSAGKEYMSIVRFKNVSDALRESPYYEKSRDPTLETLRCMLSKVNFRERPLLTRRTDAYNYLQNYVETRGYNFSLGSIPLIVEALFEIYPRASRLFLLQSLENLFVKVGDYEVLYLELALIQVLRRIDAAMNSGEQEVVYGSLEDSAGKESGQAGGAQSQPDAAATRSETPSAESGVDLMNSSAEIRAVTRLAREPSIPKTLCDDAENYYQAKRLEQT